MRSNPWVATLVVVALVAVASPPVAATVARGAQAASQHGLLVATDVLSLPAGSTVRPLPPGATVRVALTLRFSNAARLSILLDQIADPRSPVYRHFLSSAEFDAQFAPSNAAVSAVEASLRGAGASGVGLTPGGFTVDGTLSASAAESLLGVHLVRFEAPGGGSGFTSLGPTTLPASLARYVGGIDGLSGAAPSEGPLANLAILSPVRPLPGGAASFVQGNGATGADWFFGSDFTQAYEATELFPGNVSSVPKATFPRDVAIATLLASAFNGTNFTTLPPWSPSVVDRYFNDTFPTGWPLPSVTGVPVNETGASTPPLPGPFNGENDTTGLETENSLDLEMAGSLAPGASLVNFYFSGELLANPVTAANAPSYLADDLGAALAHNYGKAHLAAVTCSFGIADLNDSEWNADLTKAAAMGVTVVASSGDQGDAPDPATGRDQGQWPLWPATAAFNGSGAISVGGVSVSLSGKPTSTFTTPPLMAAYDPTVQPLASSTVWWDVSGGFGHYAGTEGGTSRVYAEPPWQFDSAAQWPIVNATEKEGFGTLGRAGPDVAFPANATVAYVAAESGGTPLFEVLGGTSVAAPVFAGLLADVVAVENATRGNVTGLGFLDPELYRIGSFYQAHPGPGDPFLPVLSGSNALFSAGPGWNPATGWGGLSAPLFLAADENATVANYTYTGPTPVLPTPAHPAPTLLTLVLVAGAAAAVVAVSAFLFARRRMGVAAVPPVTPYFLAPPPTGQAAGPTAPFATFACPYCGAPRPAEPGHCPTCGAM